MKMVIDITEQAYNLLQNEGVDWLGAEHILDAVAKGKPVEECEDCVSLDAVIDVFDTWWARNHESDNAIEILEDKLNALPPVKPVEKVGQWIVKGESWYCSRCNEPICEIYDGKPYEKYCPNCGAKMWEVEE